MFIRQNPNLPGTVALAHSVPSGEDTTATADGNCIWQVPDGTSAVPRFETSGQSLAAQRIGFAPRGGPNWEAIVLLGLCLPAE